MGILVEYSIRQLANRWCESQAAGTCVLHQGSCEFDARGRRLRGGHHGVLIIRGARIDCRADSIAHWVETLCFVLSYGAERGVAPAVYRR